MNNQKTDWFVHRFMNRVVDWGVHGAVSWAVGAVSWRIVADAMKNVEDDPEHPGLRDFIDEVGMSR